MISYGYELKLGFVIPLDDLKKVLAGITDNNHQWAAYPVPFIVPASEGAPRGYVAIGYSNPDSYPNPNYLAYLFPMFAHGAVPSFPRGPENLLVCLHPMSASSLSRGLYIEEGDIKYDTLEDWQRFWNPLKGALSAAHQAEASVGFPPLQAAGSSPAA